MPSAKQKLGTLAEHATEDFLRSHGFIIIDRHVTSRYGEIDILAQDGGTLVAVEVKVRRSNRFGTAVESITKRKLEKLVAALQDIQNKKKLQTEDIRIDLIALDPGAIPGQFSVSHIAGISMSN